MPLVIGHRGASALEPENSLAAFRRAALDGADGVELDVLLCATGEVVVFHDDDLRRLAGRSERIADLSLADVREVVLNSGARIPTLEEVFEECGPELLVNVELKASALSKDGMRKLVAGVLAVIQRANVAPRVVISSFHPKILAYWKAAAAHIPFGFLFEQDSSFLLRRAWPLMWLHPFSAHPENVLCTPRATSRWHQHGYRVNVWTVDDETELRRFREMGVDGIITNDPGRTIGILRSVELSRL